MAKAKPILGLHPDESASFSLPQIFSVRIAELWSFSRHLPHPERVQELHDMRIAAKRLRYCFEFFQPCLGSGMKKPLEQFKKLQDYLGEIHDSDVWMDYLRTELARAFRDLERGRRRLGGHLGADAVLGRKAAALAQQLSAGPAHGLLQMIDDVVKRRERLYQELVAFWAELEAQDFRGQLLRAVAGATGPAPGEVPKAQETAGPVEASASDQGQQTAAESDWPVGEVRAALDIGSNSVKLLVLKRTRGGHTVLADVNQVTGLGRGVSASGELDPAAVDATLEVLFGLIKHARDLGAERIAAAGTAALRSASNPEAVLGPLAHAAGVQARVVSGDEEAQLARAVAIKELKGRSVVLFDTGGGSTELSWFLGGELRDSVSVGLGARRLTELAQVQHPVTEAMRRRLNRLIRAELAQVRKPEGAPPVLGGLGGTATVVVWMLQGQRGEDKGDPHGTVLTLSALRGLQAALARKTRDEVLAIRNLDPLRADIIYSGVAILVKILEHYGAAQFKVVDRGLRWGLLLG